MAAMVATAPTAFNIMTQIKISQTNEKKNPRNHAHEKVQQMVRIRRKQYEAIVIAKNSARHNPTLVNSFTLHSNV